MRRPRAFRSLLAPAHRRMSKPVQADSLGMFATASGDWDLLLLPSMIQADASLWYDRSGKGHHGTPAAGCTYDTSGPAPSLLLNGSGQIVEGALSGISDDALTVFVLEQTIDSYAGSRGVILELTDDAGTVFERSVSISRQFTVDVARSAQVDTANAGLVPVVGTEANVTLQVGIFRAATRALVTNGKYRAGSAVPVTPARTVTKYRIGAYFAGGGGAWHGRIFAVGIVAGILTDKEREAAQSYFLALAGISEPFAWPFPGATNASADPLFNLPDMDVVAGRAVEIFKWPAAKRDGYDSSLVASSTLSMSADVADDRWSVTPPAAGTYSFSVAAAGHSATFSMVASNLPGAVSSKVVVGIGDSNMARAVAAMEILRGILGNKISFAGTVAPPAGYTQYTEGHDGQTWSYFNTAGSPLWAGGGALDIPGWIANIGATPDGIILAAGQNDVYASSPANVDTVVAAAFVHLEAIIAALRVTLPTAPFWLSLNYPLSADPGNWSGAAQRTEYFYKVYRYAQLLVAQFGGRTAEGLYLLPTFCRIDPVRGYGPESIHMIPEPGHRQLAEAWLGAFCRRLWA